MAGSIVKPTKPPVAVIALSSNAVLTPMVSSSPIKGAYVQHPHTSARNYAAIVAAFPKKARVGEDTPVLIDGTVITPLTPFRFIMTPLFHQYDAMNDSNGNVVRTWPIGEGPGYNRDPQGESSKEFVDAVIIALVEDSNSESDPPAIALYPARMRLSAGKTKMMKEAYEALAGMDPKAKEFAALTKAGIQPWAFKIHTAEYDGDNVGKSSKKGYYVSHATSETMTAEQAKHFARVYTEPAFVEAFNTCVEGFTETKGKNDQMGSGGSGDVAPPS